MHDVPGYDGLHDAVGPEEYAGVGVVEAKRQQIIHQYAGHDVEQRLQHRAVDEVVVPLGRSAFHQVQDAGYGHAAQQEHAQQAYQKEQYDERELCEALAPQQVHADVLKKGFKEDSQAGKELETVHVVVVA